MIRLVFLIAMLHSITVSAPGFDLAARGEEIDYFVSMDGNHTYAAIDCRDLLSFRILADSFHAAGGNCDLKYCPGGICAVLRNGTISWQSWHNGTVAGGELRGNFSFHQEMT